MTLFLIILVLLLAGVCAFILFSKNSDLYNTIFGNSITRRIEKRKRIEGEVEVLKKQQKVESERVVKSYNTKRETFINNTKVQISNYEAQIKALENQQEATLSLYAEQQKVALDEVINEFDRKIMNKINKAKKLNYLVEAEQKNIQDIVEPGQPNAPRKRVKLNEEIKRLDSEEVEKSDKE